MNIIELRNCTKTYKKHGKKIEVLKSVLYSFESGKFYAIMGESGSGKSTLVNSIVGFIKLDKGKIIIDGISPEGDKSFSDIRSKKIGLVYQNFLLNDNMTAFENTILPTYLINDFKDRKNEVKKLLEDLGLENRMNHYPKELSGGECQRVAIARALVNNPKIIIADEPTGNLDDNNEKYVFSLLKKIANDGKCIIVVTHNKEIKKYCDKILELKDGDLHEI